MPEYGLQGPLRPVALSVIPPGLAPTGSYSVVLKTKLFVFSKYTILFLAFLMVCFLGLGCPSPPDSPANLLFLDSTQVSPSLKPHRQSLFTSVHLCPCFHYFIAPKGPVVHPTPCFSFSLSLPSSLTSFAAEPSPKKLLNGILLVQAGAWSALPPNCLSSLVGVPEDRCQLSFRNVVLDF